MASAARSLRLGCGSCRSQRPIQNAGPKIFVAWKSVGGGPIKDVEIPDAGPAKATQFARFPEESKAISRKWRFRSPEYIMQEMLRQSPEARAKSSPYQIEALQDEIKAVTTDPEILRIRESILEQGRTMRKVEIPKRDVFWDEDEMDNTLITNDDSDQFDENDITDLAHAKLEEVREQRAYARLAIWEMPLLAQLAKPFEPPSMDQPLRFRYTTYMGEFHPAEKKVVVEFSPSDFGLTDVQKEKMKKLAGVRYNPEKDIIKMSCESFEHQAQNKRYLAETVEKLVEDAKDPTDTFEDVPLDLRHHKMKVKPKFPPGWRLSPERSQEVLAYRQEVKLLEEQKVAEGRLIDGREVIEKTRARKARELSEMVTVPQSRSRNRPMPARF